MEAELMDELWGMAFVMLMTAIILAVNKEK